MANNQLQLSNNKTEMIPIAAKTRLNTVLHTVHKPGRLWLQTAKTVRTWSVCLSSSHSLSNSKYPPFVWNFVGSAQYGTICPKMSPKKLLYVFVLSRLDYCNSLFWLAGLKIVFLNSKRYRTMLPDSLSEHPDPPTSLLCSFFSLASYWSEDRIQVVFAHH